MRPVSSWGRLGAPPHDVIELNDRDTVAAALTANRPGIAYGLGRSYGDACLNPDGVLWRTAGLDRLISFDADSGRLVCEAGVVLRDIQRLMIPRGWSLPVVPGTQFVTVGGRSPTTCTARTITRRHVRRACAGCGWRAATARRSTAARTCGPTVRATVAGSA
jgi:hypothetical protein